MEIDNDFRGLGDCSLARVLCPLFWLTCVKTWVGFDMNAVLVFRSVKSSAGSRRKGSP